MNRKLDDARGIGGMITFEERLRLAERAYAEGRIIQHSWRGRSPDGRELVCALTAFGPDITTPGECPADLMPLWMANVVVTLNDGIAADDLPWFASQLLDRARRWRALDDRAWDRVSLAYRRACIRQALDYAERLQRTPRPAYWNDVQNACGAVLRALSGEGALAAAAEAAGETAWSKTKAARSDDAESAARAAASTAWAAGKGDAPATWRSAAVAEWEAQPLTGTEADDEAAKAPAYRKLAEALFALLDAEIVEAHGSPAMLT